MPDWHELRQRFQKNDFFTVTALSGWIYVYKAKTVIEMIFWYLVIGVFMALTVYNVCQLALYYAAQQIHFRVILASSNNEIQIPDITLTLNLPVLELSEVLTSAIAHDDCWQTSEKNYLLEPLLVLIDYMCVHSPFEPYSGGYQAMYQNQMLTELLAQLQQKMSKPFHELIHISEKLDVSDVDLNRNRTLKKWQNEMNRANASLLEFFHHVIATEVQDKQQACDIMDQIYVLSNAPLTARSNDTLLKLLLLEAIQTGGDPRASFVQPESPISALNILSKLGVTTRQLFGEVLKDLNKVVHISTQPEAELFLRNWTLAYNDNPGLIDIQQILTFSLVPPRKTQNLEIKIYSYTFMWLHHLLSTWNKIIKYQLEDGAYDELDFCGNSNGKHLTDQIFDFWQAYYIIFYELLNTVTLQLPDGTRVELFAGTGHAITLLPTISFQSNLAGCFNKSVQDCVDQCVTQGHQEKCQCAPWTMSPYFDPDTSLCAAPCPSSITSWHCAKLCAKTISHSCNLLSAQTSAKDGHMGSTADFLRNVFEFTSVRLSIPEGRHYMRAIAEHEMSRNKFLSLLGGSIELWGVFTITALIHAGAYIVLQSVYSCITSKQDQTEQLNLEVEQKNLEEAVHVLRESVNKHVNDGLWVRLRKSSFYEETPISGYVYIAAAKSIVEAVFWLTMIIIFGTCATVNVYNTISRFASNPTHINVMPITYEETLTLPNMTMRLHLPLCELTSQAFNLKPMFDPNKLHTMKELENILQSLIDYDLYTEEVNRTSEALRAALVNDLSTQLNHPSLSFGQQKAQTRALLFDDAILEQWKGIKNKALEELKQTIIEYDHTSKYNSVELQQVTTKLFLEPFQYGQRKELFLKSMLLHGIKVGNLEFDHIQLNSSQISDKFQHTVWSTRSLLASTIASLGQLFHVHTSSPSQILLTDLSVSHWHLTLELVVNIDENVQDLEVTVHSLMFDWLSHILYGGGIELLELFQSSYNHAYLVLRLYVLRFQELDNWFSIASHAQLMTRDLAQPFHTYVNSQKEKVDVPVITKWQLNSKTSLCVEENNYTMCVMDCLKNQYTSQCGCIPWHLEHLNPTQELCSNPCPVVNESYCHSACSFKLCEVKSIEYGPEEIMQDSINYGNMMQFRLYPKQHLHMKLIEQYDFTLGTLMGELGGLCDFWLGVNLFAILHATVHALKLCIKYRRKMASRGIANRRGRTELNFWKKKKAQLTDLRKLIHNSILALRNAATADKLATHVKRGRLSWFRHNKFFADTPLSIFPFINTAQSRAEVIFWCLALMGFSLHTSINLYAVVDNYRSKPTKIEAHFSEDQIVAMTNMSLSLNIPLLELSNADPTQLYLKDMSKSRVNKKPVSMIDFMVCGVTDTRDGFVNSDLDAFISEWLRSYNWKLEMPSVALNTDLSSPKTIQHWHNVFREASRNLSLFMAKNNEAKHDYTSQKKLDELRAEFFELLAAPMRRFSRAYLPFFVLDGFKSGQHPQEKIVQMVKQDPITFGYSRFENADQVDLFEHKMSLGDIMHGLTPLEIYKLAQHYLGMQLHVNIRGVENAKVYLKDWDFKPVIDIMDWLRYQTIELTVVFPASNRATSVDFEVRSYSHVWHSYILDTFYNHYQARGRVNDSLCMGYDLQDLLDVQFGAYYRDWWLTAGQLTVHPDDRNDLQFRSFDKQTKEFQSIMTLSSMTDNCVTNSFEYCFTMCQSDAYLNKYGCVPWTLAYLVEHRPICTEPYTLPDTTTSDCDKGCELKLLHPCHMGIYKVGSTLEMEEKKVTYFDFELPVYSFSIIKPKNQHIKYTESYELSFGSLIGQLGGLLDLYLGINILSLVHLIAYIVKQSYNFVANDRKAKSNVIAPNTGSAGNLQKINLLEMKLETQIQCISKEIEGQLLKLSTKTAPTSKQ